MQLNEFLEHGVVGWIVVNLVDNDTQRQSSDPQRQGLLHPKAGVVRGAHPDREARPQAASEGGAGGQLVAQQHKSCIVAKAGDEGERMGVARVDIERAQRILNQLELEP